MRRCDRTGPIVALLLAAGCARTAQIRQPELPQLSRDAEKTKDPEVAGYWLLRELISPGADAATAIKARARLDALGPGGLLAALARGMDDGFHGRLGPASGHYLEAVRAARDSNDPRAPLFGWFAANRAVAFSNDAPGLWKQWQPVVEQIIAAPRHAGWRARSELVEWALDEAWASGDTQVDARAVKLYGCLTTARLAGPFGRGAPADATRRFAAEDPGPWPYAWAKEPGVARPPHVLSTQVHSCAVETDQTPGDGVYYVESFFDLPKAEDVIVAVQGAIAVRVDDQSVLDRDVRVWGVWPKFGVRVALGAGRHRLVARLGEPSTSIRVLRPDGTPSDAKPTTADFLGHIPAKVVARDANVLDPWLTASGVRDPSDDLIRALGAFVAHVDDSDDVASVMIAPLVAKPDRAAGPALSLAAMFASADPIFERAQSNDLVREFHERAVARDPRLWASRESLALGVAEKKGAAEAVPELQRLAVQFPGVPEVLLSLARIYGELGWAPEHSQTIKRLVARFPDDLGALHAAVDVFDEEGDYKAVDTFLDRIKRLDRDDEVAVTRALARQDYATAIAELKRLAALHPDRKDLEERIADAKVRAGDDRAATKKLETAVAKDPTNAKARLDLADSKYAAGNEKALPGALAESVQAGASTELLTSAIDLVDGVTELEPYRLDGKKIIAEFDKSGREMPGTAARILDYSALWIRADGSSRMLEHEIVRVQSAEAISAFAEHRAPEGLVLHMRVIKKDGTTLEPEFVAGKPTVTFPHLEVGDCIETEQIIYTPSDGQGLVYVGPRWFFREENVGYARSEFVVISPENKHLVVETTGAVPPPTIEHREGLVTRRFRVDESPAAPKEPNSVPATEFLPSVQIGWGVTLDHRLRAVGDALESVAPVDPRVRRIAEGIVVGVPKSDDLGRAKRLYRWLHDNVEPGDETDGRRVIIGKHGNLWHGFRMLCRALDLRVRYAVAENRLAPPPSGPLSEAMIYSQAVANVVGRKESAWLTIGNKYAPFGYLPANVRGMPAYYVDGAREKTTLPERSGTDGIAFSGTGTLDASGALSLKLVEQFSGKLAMAIRRGLSQVSERELPSVLESKLLARALHGGSLVDYEIEHRDDYDAPLAIRMTVKVARFAERSGKQLVFTPPMTPELGRLVSLPERQTPLLIPETLHRTVSIAIRLPKNAQASGVGARSFAHGPSHIVIGDSTKGDVVHIERTIDFPAGRTSPAEYPAFAEYVRQAEDALSRPVQVVTR